MVLEDICEFIVDCPHSTAPDEGRGYPIIRTPNVGKGRLILDGVQKVSKETYDNIVDNFVKIVNNNIENKYKVGVYSGRWYAMNRLGKISKSYVDWVAEYNKDCKYDLSYSMWQYTSKGRIPGINGNVDISYLK